MQLEQPEKNQYQIKSSLKQYELMGIAPDS